MLGGNSAILSMRRREGCSGGQCGSCLVRQLRLEPEQGAVHGICPGWSRCRGRPVYRGCTDTACPVDDVALHVPHSLYFAGWSDRWGGTSAGFITHGSQEPAAFARAYLITRGQFVEVVSQENANVVPGGRLRSEGAAGQTSGHARMLGTGAYRELVYCGEMDGHPKLTFTAAIDRTDFTTSLGRLPVRDRQGLAGMPWLERCGGHRVPGRPAGRAGDVDTRATGRPARHGALPPPRPPVSTRSYGSGLLASSSDTTGAASRCPVPSPCPDPRPSSDGPGEDDLRRRHHQHHDGDDPLAAAHLLEDRVQLNPDRQSLGEERERDGAHPGDGLRGGLRFRGRGPGGEGDQEGARRPDERVVLPDTTARASASWTEDGIGDRRADDGQSDQHPHGVGLPAEQPVDAGPPRRAAHRAPGRRRPRRRPGARPSCGPSPAR